jgi:hypothetical protein
MKIAWRLLDAIFIVIVEARAFSIRRSTLPRNGRSIAHAHYPADIPTCSHGVIALFV